MQAIPRIQRGKSHRSVYASPGSISVDSIGEFTFVEEDEPDETHVHVAWRKEAMLLLYLAVPTVVINLGVPLPQALSASIVGREFGSVYLDGFTLANLMANLFCLSLLQGLLTAADTLSPQAFAAGNFRELGLLAIRGYVASLAILIPTNVALVWFFKVIMIAFGQEPEVAEQAHRWYAVYALALPFYALYMVTWKFLSAQEIMQPLVYVCLVCLGAIFPVALFLLTRWFNYLGSALAIVSFQVCQATMLVLYLKRFHPHSDGTWPGLSWETVKDALNWPSFKLFVTLGMGGMLATSEWIYWELLGLLIGTLGVVPLSVHTIPTQTIMVGFMFPLGIGIALSVRLGATLPICVKRAKELTIGCMAASVVLLACLSGWMYFDRDRLFHVFTNEPEVLEGCERIWWKVVIYFFNLGVYGVNMGIATGLSMQWYFGYVTIIFLYAISLPGMFYFAILRGGGLEAAWTWIYPPYVIMNLIFFYAYCRKDWEEVRKEIREREGMDELPEYKNGDGISHAPGKRLLNGKKTANGYSNEGTPLLN